MFTRLITPKSIALAALAYLMVIVATTRTSFGGPAGSMQAGTASLDACSLLTAVDVQAATKRPVRPPAKSATANLATCTFDDPKDPTSKVLNLNVLVSANAADAKKALAIAKSNAADVQPVFSPWRGGLLGQVSSRTSNRQRPLSTRPRTRF